MVGAEGPYITSAMKLNITNRNNLPAPLVAAIQNDPYSAGDSDATATSLIKPPRIVALEKLHRAEITEDASDRIWSLVGQIGHSILERAAKAGHKVAEERLYRECLGWKVGGQIDLIDGVISDYKFTTVWSCKNGLKPEWEQQQNILNWLALGNDKVVTGMEIVALYRDWSVLEARRDSTYPQAQVQVFKVPEWAPVQAQVWIEGRVLLHKEAQAGNLPECSPEERWAKPEKFAVKKPGADRARRVLDTSAEAAKEMKPGEIIEHRPGENTRCEAYCAAAPFCSQFKALKGVVTP